MFRARGVVLALVLVLVLPQDAAALSWASGVKLTSSRNAFISSGVLVAGSTMHVAYDEARGGINRIRYRRSTDGGATWAAPIVLSRPTAVYSTSPALSGVGEELAMAWTEWIGGRVWLILVSTSGDGGLTWTAPRAISPSTGDAGIPRVARDANDRIAVVWADTTTGVIRVRRSVDGGATWLSSQTLATTTNQPQTGIREGWPDIAFGATSWYLAYHVVPGAIHVRRSTDAGVSWSSATTVTSSAWQRPVELDADAQYAIVGYGLRTDTDLYAAVRRTTDAGATWSAEQAVAAPAAPYSFTPIVQVSGGIWRVAYEQCGTDDCDGSAALYRQSTNGTTWSAAVRVSNTARPYNRPGGLDAGSKVLIGYFSGDPVLDDSDVIVRVGS